MGKSKRILAVVVFFALLFALAEISGLREHFNLPYLRAKLDANKLSGLIIFVLLFVFGNLIHIPGMLFLAAAILALGQMWGGLVTYVAAVVSSGVTFFTVRYVGGDLLGRLTSRLALKILAHLHGRPIRGVVLLRLLFQTLPTVNYALALSAVRFRSYMIGTMLGLPLPIVVFCVFFDALSRLLLRA